MDVRHGKLKKATKETGLISKQHDDIYDGHKNIQQRTTMYIKNRNKMSEIFTRRGLTWIGHLLRMDNKISVTALTWKS